MNESYDNWQSPKMRIETKGVQALSDGELLTALINSGKRNNSVPSNLSAGCAQKENYIHVITTVAC